MEDHSDRWIVVADYSNHPEAKLAKNLLQSFGIRSQIWSDDCVGLAVGQTVVQGVRLFVTDRDVYESKHILGSW